MMTTFLIIGGFAVFVGLLLWAYWEFELYKPEKIAITIVVGILAFSFDTYISYASTFLKEPSVRVTMLKEHLLFRDGYHAPLSSRFPIDMRIVYHAAWVLTVASLIANGRRRRHEQRAEDKDLKSSSPL
jgi:membrane-anchored glycerophosphoryl diester phosphodiesterase (GDPDase)